MPHPNDRALTPEEIANELEKLKNDYDKADAADERMILEEADYLLGVQDFSWKRFSSGNVGIKVRFVTIETKKPVSIYNNFVMTEANLPFLKRDLALMGIKIKSLSDLQSVNFMEVACKAHIGVRTYENKKFNEIRWFMGINDAERARILTSDISTTDIPADDDLPF